MSRSLALRALDELLGTCFLVGVGTGAIVAAARAGLQSPLALAAAWAFAVAVPVLLLADRSGAHLNPAVTLCLWRAGRFPGREVVAYVVAQIAGAFAASLTVLALGGQVASLGATVPRGGDLWIILPLEIPFTVALLAVVLFLTEPGRTPRTVELLLPAAVVGASTYVIGPWTGSSLNPARSLAPAVLSGTTTGLLLYFLAATLSIGLAVAGRRAVDPDRGRRSRSADGR